MDLWKWSKTIELFDLPLELLEYILGKMSNRELKTLSRTNKYLYGLTERLIVEKCRLNQPFPYFGALTSIILKRNYKAINPVLFYEKHVRINLLNGRISEMVVKGDHDVDEYVRWNAWSEGWGTSEYDKPSCEEHSIGCYLHITVNTAQYQCPLLRQFVDGSLKYEICKLYISSQVPQDVWRVANQWSATKMIKELNVVMETYLPDTEEYRLMQERTQFRRISFKNTGDVNLIKQLVNSSKGFTKILELEDCRTDFEISVNGLKSFKCVHKETVNIDSIFKFQNRLLCVFLSHVEITEALLRILGRNKLRGLFIYNCSIEGEITNDSFLFVESLSEVAFYSNPEPLSAFMWNNLKNVKTLIVGLQHPRGLEKKKLSALDRIIVHDPKPETKAIVEQFLDLPKNVRID